MDSAVVERIKKARLSPQDFLAQMQAAIESTPANFAVLAVQLNRADRTAALAQDPVSMVVMRQVSERIEEILKPNDYYCVVAHDEVWIFLDSVNSESIVNLAAHGISSALKPVFSVQKGPGQLRTVRMNPSIGAAVILNCVTDQSEILHIMGEAAAQARRSDSLIAIQKVSEEASVAKRAQLESELRQALFANELEVFYQPQIDLRTKRCVSAEALIRWTRANGKPVNAGLIAKICEETGLMETLTRFVLNNALRFQSSLRANGLDLKIAVNLAAGTLSDSEFPQLVLQAAQTWGVSPSCLVFEVTEGSLVENERAALKFMSDLKALGCEISIDDFGTGYSALAYLKTYPFSELKIDRTFVQGLGQEENSMKLVRVLSDLSKIMGLRCVAEGIETEHAQHLLAKLGVDIGQGYHFARALPASEFLSWAVKFNQRAN